jgi:hypothetical protein
VGGLDRRSDGGLTDYKLLLKGGAAVPVTILALGNLGGGCPDSGATTPLGRIRPHGNPLIGTLPKPFQQPPAR